jgi:L-ascorbate metabolism protein UlaG (beta-lactamase superfamily)
MKHPSPSRTAPRPVRRRKPVAVTWFGHSAFRFESPSGRVLIIDPWLSNPSAPAGALTIDKADAILVTHGHSDHLGETVPLAQRTGARVFAIHEVSLYLRKQGLADVVGMNKSGSVRLDGITITMVDASHSGGIETAAGVIPGGEPAGFIVKFENDLVVYHAGDTGLFGDMRLLAQLYKPDVAILPIGGLYTMGPAEAAKACAWLKPRHILGMHYGTFPALSGTPAELRRYLPAPLKRCLHELVPGQTLALA